MIMSESLRKTCSLSVLHNVWNSDKPIHSFLHHVRCTYMFALMTFFLRFWVVLDMTTDMYKALFGNKLLGQFTSFWGFHLRQLSANVIA